MRFSSFMRATGFVPTPAQNVFVRVAFDGEEPGSLRGTDRELARQLFGCDVETIPRDARDVVCLVKGARIGGSRMAGIRLAHLALTVDLSTIAPGERAAAIAVAPDLKLAPQVLRFALGALETTPALAGLVGNVTESSFTVDRGNGRLVSIECLAASAGGRATRGRSLVGAVMSEGAFFKDREAAVSDEEIFRSILPRLMPGGQLIIESTPYAEIGLLWELWEANFNQPDTCLAVHAPTLLMRDGDPRIAAHVARERKRDPENAEREFDARFLTAGSDLFFDPAAIDRCAALEVPE